MYQLAQAEPLDNDSINSSQDQCGKCTNGEIESDEVNEVQRNCFSHYLSTMMSSSQHTLKCLVGTAGQLLRFLLSSSPATATATDTVCRIVTSPFYSISA